MLKNIGRYQLYLPIPILLADTTKIGQYHRYRYLSIGTSLVKTHFNKSQSYETSIFNNVQGVTKKPDCYYKNFNTTYFDNL